MPEFPPKIVFGEAIRLPEPDVAAGGAQGFLAEHRSFTWEPPPGRTFDPDGLRMALRDDLLAARAKAMALPGEAFPEGLVMLDLSLRRACLWPGRFPRLLFSELGLIELGSRHVRRLRRGLDWAPGPPGQSEFVSVYAVISLDGLEKAARLAAGLSEASTRQLLALEALELEDAAAKLMPGVRMGLTHYEIVLQNVPGRAGPFPYDQFKAFAAGLGFEAQEEYRFVCCGVTVVPVKGPGPLLARLAEFSFVRQAGEIPRPRPFRPLRPRSARRVAAPADDPGTAALAPAGSGPAMAVALPGPDLGLADQRVIILDAGLPDGHPIGPWVKEYLRADPMAGDYPGGPGHGLAVASAFLFGSLGGDGGHGARPPFSPVTAMRVLDSFNAGGDDLAMLRVLGRIRDVLRTGRYRFANLSLGPERPVLDGRIHAWTAILDELACHFGLFLTVAAGNNGAEENPRIQVPADAVNVVSVGAIDSRGPLAGRAAYSATGPGRGSSPVKPDLAVFGGGPDDPFVVLDDDRDGGEAHGEGTSFAAPLLLGQAVGLLALSGQDLSNATIRALLVHAADRRGHGPDEVGWGVCPGAAEVLAGRRGETRLVFQGTLPPGGHVLARLPAPGGGSGRWTLRATLCFHSHVSIHDPLVYARTAISASLFPDLAGAGEDAWPPGRPEPFFDLDGGEPDDGASPLQVSLANVRSNGRTFEASGLPEPGFVVRQIDLGAQPPAPVEYALVASLAPASP
ncbi:MAG: S8 family peptidase [Deltaproteobacteria bacterium]|jgi:hypothetical protein|nr:S8 family peptidase [Deltaproteobacteria bacterium]